MTTPGRVYRRLPAFPLGFPTALQFTATLGPLLGAVLGAWVQSKVGRKVRLKIGDIEARGPYG